jgi:uncharacterized protein YycO
MPENKIILAISILLILLLILLMSKNDPIKITEADNAQFENFDIILSKGNSFHSRLINLFNYSADNYSHVGVVIKEGNKAFVLHSTPDGTKSNGIRYDSLQTFVSLSNVNEYLILRYPDISPASQDKVFAEFSKYKSKAYPFDYDFNNKDQSKIYCSELIWLIFKDISPPIMDGLNLDKPIHPKSFLKLNGFKKITRG